MRKLITILVMLAMAGLGLVACGSQDEASINWTPPATMAGNAVKYDCTLFDSTKSLSEQPARGPGWWYNNAISGEDSEVTKLVFGATDPSQEDKDKLKEMLEVNLKECKPGNEPKANVTPRDGALQQLPTVQGGETVRGDSTGYRETPSVLSTDIIKECGVLATWKSLVDCVGNRQWYKDGVNQMKPYTGFDWSDVQKWANDGQSIDARVIQVYNLDISDNDARDAVRQLIGDAADKLEIVRHGDMVNTRGLEQDTMSPFLDRKSQVRVSLAPLVYESGKPARIRSDAGVFVDCLNVWAIPKAVGEVPPSPTPSSTPPPPGNPPGTVPPSTNPPTTNPPPVCPPGTTGKPPVCKDLPSDGPAHNPALPDQQRPNPLPARPDHAQPNRPADPPATYTPPPTQRPTVAPPVTPHETPRPTPPPVETGAPDVSNPGTGCVPAPGKSC